MSVLAELLALAERQVAELSRPLSDRKAETVTDCLWPIVRIEHRAGKRPHEASFGSERAAGVKTARFRSVQRFPARHLPRFQGNERCSRVWNGRAGSARP